MAPFNKIELLFLSLVIRPYIFWLIAVLTGAVGRAGKRSLIVRFTVSGRAPCSGAKRRDKELDAVSTAIHGGEAAVNAWHEGLGKLAVALKTIKKMTFRRPG